MSWWNRWGETWTYRVGVTVALVLVVTALVITAALWVESQKPCPKPLDCAAQCAPRDVLPGSAAICNCAPSEAWIVKVIEQSDKACPGLPFDVRASASGDFELTCGRPEKIRALWKKGN